MVAFGKALKRSQRDGWETAYLDYSKLKRILSELENSPQSHEDDDDVEAINGEGANHIVASRSEENDISYIRVKESFFQELGEEIEKVSLFILKRQGTLSEAVGHLRFRDDDTINATELICRLRIRCSSVAHRHSLHCDLHVLFAPSLLKGKKHNKKYKMLLRTFFYLR